jgi:hypothetical protein
MKKGLLSTLALIALCANNLWAQDRVNTAPKSLSYKSQEIKTALFWNHNSSTGEWSSQLAKYDYLGSNFRSIFIGEYEECRYLFLDHLKGTYRYPNIKVDYYYYREMVATLLSDEDYEKLKNISQEGEVVIVTSNYQNEASKNTVSFPTFLNLTETLRSTEEILKQGAELLGEKYEEEGPYTPMIAKRVISNGIDVVRFQIPPLSTIVNSPLSSIDKSMEDSYYEIEYSEFQKLFLPDKKVTYK